MGIWRRLRNEDVEGAALGGLGIAAVQGYHFGVNTAVGAFLIAFVVGTPVRAWYRERRWRRLPPPPLTAGSN